MAKKNPKIDPDALRRLREEAGITQADLGRLAGGVSNITISRYEQGAWPRPRTLTVRRLVLGLSKAHGRKVAPAEITLAEPEPAEVAS